ncbi:hypothetical protein SLS55_007728 [Diplodia seriata]|uniref:Xylanolytic transcriptional activator regulatory domain-containing protein n=1 Tax=Diplodia seriata TaxID=420778 RepID=A0ABR3C8G4_9PEZI
MRRKFTCIYLDREDQPEDGPPTKKVQTENGAATSSAHPGGAGEAHQDQVGVNGNHKSSPTLPKASAPSSQQPGTNFHVQKPKKRSNHASSKPLESVAPTFEPDALEAAEAAARSLQHFATRVEEPPKPHAASNTASTDGNEEEAVVYSQMRMLQDPTGRLLYVGDAASLSFLQLLRMMVENVAGPSAFTTDPRRHKITEIPFSLPATMRHTHLLPDKRTAYILVESFFINTHGFLQVFERHAFTAALERCYSDPLTTEPPWLCLLNLVFAIGLMLATPRPDTPDAAIIEKLHRDHPDRAEVFYMNAKSLNDPLHGFEDADFWSVQALLLMSYYMLVKSKRNTSFALLGT